ncbi:MAG: metallophosphoesterase [Planctomycetota bacterium]
MKIGVLSDTHDRLPTFRRALELFRRLDVDAVFHAGDLVAPFAAKLLTPDDGPLSPSTPIHVIYGNNDGERDGLKQILPQIADGPLRVTLDASPGPKTVIMGHYLGWLQPADLAGADVVVTGHDHTAKIEAKTAGDRRVLFLNPGECCGWVHGRCTAALLDLSNAEPSAELVEVHG